MRYFLPLAIPAALAACSQPAAPPPPPAEEAEAAPAGGESGWRLSSEGAGASLRFSGSEGQQLSLWCDGPTLRINAAGFDPVGSEERLSFGQGGEVMALVADPRGDQVRGGVSASAPVPANLSALLNGPVSASYGAQRVGPLPAPPPSLARAFVAACRRVNSEPVKPKPVPPTSPCWEQDGKAIRATPLRAVGTEPFWGARIEGRCVTYSTPEDQAGTRIWTRTSPAPGGSIYEGAFVGRRFRLEIRAAANCSDGMSDDRYPMAAALIVNGENRRGCARPAP